MKCGISAGDLDQRVTLQAFSLTRDAVGGPVETFSDLATVWAFVKAVSGRRAQLASAVEAMVNIEVHIRYRSGLSSAMRVKFSDGRLAKVAWIEEFPREGEAVLVVELIDG